MLQTYDVSFDMGPSKAGAVVGAALGSRQISATEQLVIHYTAAIADSLGRGSLALWSNAALNNGSRYTVVISHPSGDQVLTDGVCPADDCDLFNMFNTTPAGALALAAGPLAISSGYLVIGA